MDLSVDIAGVRLEHPIMNAAGTCKTVEEAEEHARSASAALMVGSITLEPREGNSGNVFWSGGAYALNSLGLPNPGAAYYEKWLPEMAKWAEREEKPLFVSVAGFSPDEYAGLAALAFEGGAALVELNLGCPNVWPGGTQKRIVCFDLSLVAEVLMCVEARVGTARPIAVKISPFSDPYQLAEIAKLLGGSEIVRAVTTTNTFPNALCLDERKNPVITPNDGLAGLSGPAMKPVGLGQVLQLRRLLPEWVQIIGVGGIAHGRDVREYQQCGAAAVQVGTAYFEREGVIFQLLLGDMLDVMDREEARAERT